jgi:hypothetical protein
MKRMMSVFTAKTRFRIALYSQVLLAAGCMASFEKYLRTHRHPGALEETVLRNADVLALAIFGWLIAESAFAEVPHWRRAVCLVASCIATVGALVLADGVYWGAVVRY